MTSTTDITNSEQRSGAEAADAPRPQAIPRVLFLNWSEPDVASGTPVIVCDMMAHFPPGHAELLCEKSYSRAKRRKVVLKHPVRKIRFPFFLWPFSRGYRIRAALGYIGFPWLVLVGCWRVLRFRPTCLVTIYFHGSWIAAAYLISRLCRVPLVYYVHDALRENVDGKSGLTSRMVSWLENKVLREARVMVLHPYLADHYRERYGIECTILRQVVWRKPQPSRSHEGNGEPLVVGFAGAIYENNRHQLADLADIVASHPRLRLKIWTDRSPAMLAKLGIAGQRVEIGFESDYERLLARLSDCDLLYLPLAFADSGPLTTNALQYAFPTKSLDYLLAGPPILVHCPANFELSRFFSDHACAHTLNEGDATKLSAWFESWLDGRQPAPDDAMRRQAIEVFSPEENRRLLWHLLAEAAGESHDASHRLQRT